MGQSVVDVFRRLQEHRVWVNEQLLDAAAKLSEEERQRVFAIGQGSLWRSFLHMYAAEYIWLETMQGNETAICPGDVRGKLPGNQLGEGGVTSFEDLREKWSEMQRRWSDYLASLSPESFDEAVYRVSASDNAGQRFVCRRSDALLHLYTHAHYTVAQVMNILRQLGVKELPQPMMISLAWQQGLPE
jgi:uncharacterized damage-inducible protein DinB